MKKSVKLGLAALLAGVAVLGVLRAQSPRNRRQDVARALKLAGFKEDDAGRIILSTEDSGLSFAFDPNLQRPSIGFRSFITRITACYDRSNQLDSCINDCPRCVSPTPWKDDPAGDDCCPESCVSEYYELRKTKEPSVAIMGVARGNCYPGMKATLSGKKP